MADLLAWCFHSPRRLAAISLGLLLLLIGGGAVISALRTPTASSPAGPAAVAGISPDTGPAVRAALAFTRVWASKPATDTDAQWRQSIDPWATPDLARGLAVTDPATLPGGTPTGQPTVRFVSVSSALIEVPLTSGPHVLVTVVSLNGRWLASDVQPAVGDPGDVPASGAPASGG